MEKIDFVLTWVDGSDPDWLAQRREYQPGRGTDAGESPNIYIPCAARWNHFPAIPV